MYHQLHNNPTLFVQVYEGGHYLTACDVYSFAICHKNICARKNFKI
jgi:hypothetical protein